MLCWRAVSPADSDGTMSTARRRWRRRADRDPSLGVSVAVLGGLEHRCIVSPDDQTRTASSTRRCAVVITRLLAWCCPAFVVVANHFVRARYQTNVNTGIVISVETANELERRNAVIEKEVDELMKAHEAKRGLASVTRQIREVEATLMSSAITLPSPTGRHPNWW